MDKVELQLIRQAQQGDRQAFAELYERYQPAIYNYLFYRIDDPDCAEELTCEVFARMVQNIRRYQDQGQPFLSWLYVIARNLRFDYYRENGKTQRLSWMKLWLGMKMTRLTLSNLR
jgi:RNA polymerase sigma-70 factor, ECF subfamily